MGELGGDLGFAQEPLATEGGRKLRPQQLERHLTIELLVVCQIDDRHPTTAELVLDRVAVAECAAQLGEDVGHAPNPEDRIRLE
jgi:hypothetical protein